MLKISYLKIGSNKGQGRIWLESKRLLKAGFEIGSKFNIHFDMDDYSITLKKTSSGLRTVSKKKETPVIDICNSYVTEMAKTFARVKVKILNRSIIITPHHLDKSRNEREERLLRTKNITSGTMCSGFAISSDALGFKSKWVMDRENSYLEVADKKNNIDTILHGSLEEFEVSNIPVVEVLNMSLPCTGHSIAGKSKNKINFAEEHTTDATAVFGAAEIIKAVNPAIITSENVPQAKDSPTYLLLKAYIRELGYNVEEVILDEGQAGTIEKRKRYWFIATSKGLPKFDVGTIPLYKNPHKCIGDILEDVPSDSPRWKRLDYLKEKEKRDAIKGNGFRRQLKNPYDTYYGTIGRHYNKYRSSEPMIVREDGLCRLLTPLEHARGKGIDPKYIEGISDTLAHQGLGQSILWNHAKGIGEAIREWIYLAKTTSLSSLNVDEGQNSQLSLI